MSGCSLSLLSLLLLLLSFFSFYSAFMNIHRIFIEVVSFPNTTKYKVHKLHQRYILKLCTLYLHACQVRVTVDDSGLCRFTCVMYFER